MVSLVTRDKLIVDKLATALVNSTGKLLQRDFNVIAAEFLAEERVTEQIELFRSQVNNYERVDFKGKKLLEIGASVGTLLICARKKYAIDAYGVEPSKNEFSPFNEISNVLLAEYNLPMDIIVCGNAEELPFGDEMFDLVYSSNVIEHVQNPSEVFSESIRVLKKGGFLQFVIPNYFSFWEGHYDILWPCITNRTLAKIYATLMGKNPQYIDTLQLITPFFLKKILLKYKDEVEILGFGKDVFKKRLTTGNYSDWASLGKLRWIVKLVQQSKIADLIAYFLNLFGMYTPIVLTLKKKD